MDGWVEGGMEGWMGGWKDQPQRGVDLSAAGPSNPCLPPPRTPGTPLREAGSYLVPAVAAGMLAGGAQKEVTLVNALLLAQEAGLKVRGHVSLLHPDPVSPRVSPWGC